MSTRSKTTDAPVFAEQFAPEPHRPQPNWHPGPWSVPQELAGTAVVTPDGPAVAGSMQSFTLVYTAGRFGIDDSGSLKVCFRFATDQTRLQLSDPQAPGFVSVEASNNAELETRFDYKLNTRPWDRTLHIKVIRGYLREGDTITVRLGDRRQGSPGIRMQTFTEPFFEFRVLVDPIACYHFVPLAQQPTIAIVAGARANWVAVLPSLTPLGEPFDLKLRSEDPWGNPTGVGAADIFPSANLAVDGLPSVLTARDGAIAECVIGIVPREAGDLIVELRDRAGVLLCRSNPMRVAPEKPAYRLYWADFHAQSGETIGTNAAEDYFAFARDIAFLDIVGHQGNDFQITPAFWRDLNTLYDRFDAPGSFVTVPGYEWSGNTALGGDRNVFFHNTGRTIRRSSHALVPDHSDIGTDCHTAADLFAAFKRDKEDVITFAHVGGRYADINVAHDPEIETAVEIHSSWGTFEWIANDAFDAGYRVGIVANSDGHKGRPGAEGPGASLFGALGGLTCVRLHELSRDAVFEALRARRHYATTGARMFLDVSARIGKSAVVFDRDPGLGRTSFRETSQAAMGEIVYAEADVATLSVDVSCGAPIVRVEIRNGRDVVHTYRPYTAQDLGRRISVIWSGAENRGRSRMTTWDGTATLKGSRFQSVSAVNFFNRDRVLRRDNESTVSWQSITTGNFAGFDAILDESNSGALRIDCRQGSVELPTAEIGLGPKVFDFGGLERKLTVSRLPDENRQRHAVIEHTIAIDKSRDNPLYVCVTTEDGHQAWSSPIYVIPKPAWL